MLLVKNDVWHYIAGFDSFFLVQHWPLSTSIALTWRDCQNLILTISSVPGLDLSDHEQWRIFHPFLFYCFCCHRTVRCILQMMIVCLLYYWCRHWWEWPAKDGSWSISSSAFLSTIDCMYQVTLFFKEEIKETVKWYRIIRPQHHSSVCMYVCTQWSIKTVNLWVSPSSVNVCFPCPHCSVIISMWFEKFLHHN